MSNPPDNTEHLSKPPVPSAPPRAIILNEEKGPASMPSFRFVKSTTGNIYPVSSITEIVPGRPHGIVPGTKEKTDSYFFGKGPPFDASCSDEFQKGMTRDLLEMHRTIVPAEPGTFTVFWDEEREDLFLGQKILGWALSADSIDRPIPLTCQGAEEEGRGNYVGAYHSNGTVETYSAIYSSLKSLQKELLELKSQKEAKNAKAN